MASRDKIIAKAEKLVAKGKIEDAIKEYERLLDENPNDVNTLNRIGDLWVRINRSDEAVRAFTKIANHYSRDGFFLKAIAIYKKINKLDPSKLDIYNNLAELYAKQGLAMEAKSQYVVLADFHLKQGDSRAALETYKKIAELDPNSINVHVKLADLYNQNNQKEDALREYDRVGRLLLKRGMLDEAVQVFKKAIKIDPSNVELLDSLVGSLLDANDTSNAIQFLESARENNPDSPRIAALLGRTHLTKGDIHAAQSVLDEAFARHPGDSSVRETLADLALKQDAPDRAFELLEPRLDALSTSRDPEVIDLINRILRVDSTHIPSLRKLVDVYMARAEETNILSSLNSLAEAFISREDYGEASRVLEDLINREPENLQHKEKLSFVRQQAGGAPPAPSEPTPAPSPPMEPEAPIASEPAVAPEEIGDFSIDFDEGPSLDLGSDSELSIAPPPEDALAEPEEPAPVAEEDGDLDFITEHMTEAEVFAKYGLTDKAVDHLAMVIDRAPKHLPAYERLLFVFLEEGRLDDASDLGARYIDVLRDLGETEAIEAVESELASKGVALGGAPEPAVVEEIVEPEASVSLEPEPEPETEAVEFEMEVPEEVPEIEMEVPEEVPEIEMEVPESIPEIEMEISEPEEDITIGGESEDEFPIELEEAEPESIVAEAGVELAETKEEAAERFFGAKADRGAGEPSQDDLSEIDFYIEQELFSEAQAKLDGLMELFGEHPEISARAGRLEAASRKAAASTAPPELSAADIETELLSAIPEDEDEISFEPPAQPAQATAPPAAAPAMDEENLFADEDDFFDLASELEDELEDELDEDISLGEEEQSLEEVFKEFKRGVQEQLDSEDYDTHYNLGIAYKEMGLIDEAIGEFQLASKDPKRAVECCSMLGLCFLEKGMPQLAVKWYSKGLEIPEITEDEHLGLMYELASAHQEVGDTTAAHKTFVEIYGVNSTYRDVVERIKQLENVAQE